MSQPPGGAVNVPPPAPASVRAEPSAQCNAHILGHFTGAGAGTRSRDRQRFVGTSIREPSSSSSSAGSSFVCRVWANMNHWTLAVK
ncbi:hypothetical protein INR49_027335 [Caranx melampygus]|nr:hypothetical protein INR49_027335 [Caranx melampygus]